MDLYDTLLRAYCCTTGPCANPAACRRHETQHIPIHIAARIGAAVAPATLCELWRATGPMSRRRVVEGRDEP